MAKKQENQTEALNVRVTKLFRSRTEQATERSGLSSVSEFIKQAVIAHAAKFGVKVKH